MWHAQILRPGGLFLDSGRVSPEQIIPADLRPAHSCSACVLCSHGPLTDLTDREEAGAMWEEEEGGVMAFWADLDEGAALLGSAQPDSGQT